jgi:hypothetical protein
VVQNQNRPRADEDDRRLLDLRAAGRSDASICEDLKRSGGSIKSRLGFLRSRKRAQGAGKPATSVKSPFALCLPTRAAKVPSSPDWIHEIKHDGYRLIVHRDDTRVSAVHPEQATTDPAAVRSYRGRATSRPAWRRASKTRSFPSDADYRV